MTQKELYVEMVKIIMEEGKVYRRRELTKMFWLAYPTMCAKLLMASPSKDRIAINVLEGILDFKALRIAYNSYSLKENE